MTLPRLLYLGFALPPGMQEQHPEVNPAGHAFEVQMLSEMRRYFDLRTVGLLPFPVHGDDVNAAAESGIRHHLILEDRPPSLFHRYRSLFRLRAAYRSWLAEGWRPDAVLPYNLSPVYNAFLRGLGQDRTRPKRILLLLDSSQLGTELPPVKRLRYRFKPLITPDAEMLGHFDACIGLSRETQPYFTPRNLPFLWMPGGCSPQRVSPEDQGIPAADKKDDPIRFGYFGALADHAGIGELARVFLATPVPALLQVCGYGRLSRGLEGLSRQDARLQFQGLLPTAEDCLRFGRSCDVLVNPRPANFGNRNNFPSKVFEYALCGRAILTTRLSGVDDVLGDAAYFLDAGRLAESLAQQLRKLAATPRVELRSRGSILQERICTQYSWKKQAARMRDFIQAQLAE